MSSITIQGSLPTAQRFVQFLNRSVTPYHAVAECVKMLKEAGFTELKDNDAWTLQQSGKYFITRNRSAIMAFVIGGAWKAGNGFSIIGAHTDSPCLRVKPVSKLNSQGCLQVGVSTYGGGLWRTWFDRDLSLAGRVFVQRDGNVQQHLVRIDEPILYIPSLCIHLDMDRDKFSPNAEEHLRPIIATEALAAELNLPTGEGDHNSALLKCVSNALGVDPKDIYDLDLYLFDTQPARVGGGLSMEIISGARLDNLVGTYTSVQALIDSCQDANSLAKDEMIRVAACYDNEECGSDSVPGAGSAATEWLLRRICTALKASEHFEQAMANSFLISADQAHAVHPNYVKYHEDNHRPKLHGGVVVKVNVNQRYATSAATHSLLKLCAQQANVPLQKVVVRNDSRCGSTIGPILSTKLGMRAIDVGTPQWAMHSIRETCCTSGIAQAIALFKTFYVNCATLMRRVELE